MCVVYDAHFLVINCCCDIIILKFFIVGYLLSIRLCLDAIQGAQNPGHIHSVVGVVPVAGPSGGRASGRSGRGIGGGRG